MVASKVMQRIAPHADIEIVEEHFKGKKDISGTARRIAGALSLDEETHINSIRVGGVIGRHEVIFGLPNQTIRVIHESINRRLSAKGAILAAQWLADKEPVFIPWSKSFRKAWPVSRSIWPVSRGGGLPGAAPGGPAKG
jgi:4-hydroxy-tetrahydrodipicolinate reductase